MIREFQEVRPARRFQLLLHRFGVHTDAHGAEFVAAACDVVQHQDVAVQVNAKVLDRTALSVGRILNRPCCRAIAWRR